MGDFQFEITLSLEWCRLVFESLKPPLEQSATELTCPFVVPWEDAIHRVHKPILRTIIKAAGSESEEFFVYRAARIGKTLTFRIKPYFSLECFKMSPTEFIKYNVVVIMILLTLNFAERVKHRSSLTSESFALQAMRLSYHYITQAVTAVRAMANIFYLTVVYFLKNMTCHTLAQIALKPSEKLQMDRNHAEISSLYFQFVLENLSWDNWFASFKKILRMTEWQLVNFSGVMKTVEEPRLRWNFNLLRLENITRAVGRFIDCTTGRADSTKMLTITQTLCDTMIEFIEMKDYRAASAVCDELSLFLCCLSTTPRQRCNIRTSFQSHSVFHCSKYLATMAANYNDDCLNCVVNNDDYLKDFWQTIFITILTQPKCSASNMELSLSVAAKHIQLYKFRFLRDKKFDWGFNVLVIFHMIMTRRLQKLGFLQQEEKDGGTRLDVEDYKNLLLFIRLSNPSSTQDSLKSILRICQGTMPSSRGSVISSKSRVKFYLVMMTYPLLSQELRITQSKLESSGESLKDSEHPILKDGDNRMYINSLLKNIQCVSLEYEEVINTLNSYSVRFSGDDTVIEYNNETCGEKCDKKMKEKNKVTSRVETVGESGLKSSSGKLLLIGEPGEYLSLADLLNKDISELFELVYSKSLDSSYIDANDHLSYIEEMRGPLGVGRFSQAIPPQEEFGDESWTLNEILLQLEEVLRQCVQALLTSCSQQSQHQQAGNKRIRKPPLESKENLKQMKCMMTRMKKNLPKDTLKRLVTVMSNMEEYLQ